MKKDKNYITIKLHKINIKIELISQFKLIFKLNYIYNL